MTGAFRGVHLREDVANNSASLSSCTLLSMSVNGECVQSAIRVGVLGCFSPMVLQSQPAKSTSSTSDRLINVWF